MSGIVRQVEAWHLVVEDGDWPFAQANAAAIDDNWRVRAEANPAFFNGTIYLMHSYAFEGATFSGRLLRTDFKSYLYWRDQGFPECGVRDAFGSALLRCGDGKILLGRQGPGHINSGLTYLPGGFIDQRDVAPDGTVDIAGSVSREVDEELGLPVGTFAAVPGAVITLAGPLISLAVVFQAQGSSAELIARIDAHLAGETNPELEAVVAVASAADVADLAMPDYAHVLLGQLLAEK